MKKKIKKKKKGFTLIEVLAAVTILGIISVVAMVSVNSVIQRAKVEHYTTAEDQLKLSGQSYVQQNRNVLPKSIGQKTKIPLKTLMEKKYIKQIKDYNDKDCDINKSYVQVFKYSQKDYSYVSYLHCPAYTSKETIEKGSPNISIEISESTKQKVANANIKITDSEKLLSWSYIIYKNGEEVKNSGSTQLPNYDKSISKTVDLSKYTPGKIKVVVTATNIYGLSTTKTSSTVDFKDTVKPQCIIKDVDKETNPKPWTSNNVTITVGCDDGEGSGCKRKEFTKTFKQTTVVGEVTIEDKEGNKTKCRVSVNVDKTAPTIPKIGLYKWSDNSKTPSSETDLTKYTADTWSPNNIFTKATGSTDEHSGFEKYQYTITGKAPNKTDTDGQTVSITTNGTSKIKYRACDKVGNCSEYSSTYIIKVDKIAPSCKSSGGDTTWTNKTRTLTGTCSDGSGDVSGCSKATITKLYDYTINSTTETPGTVSDIAGNTTLCPENQTVKIDKIAPTAPTGGAIGNVSGTDKNASIKTDASGSTDKGGSGFSHYLYYVKTTSETPKNSSTEFTKSKDYTRACGQTNYAFAIAVDGAGNRSTVSSLGSSSDGVNKYSAWTECTAKCDGGTQTRTNSCMLVTDKLKQECNKRGCCSSTEITDYGSWSSCSASCGPGTKKRTVYRKSSYNGQECPSTTETKSCDGGSCCSDDNPYGCNWVTSCRLGNTYIYTSSSATSYAGTVYHNPNGGSDKLYVLGRSGSLTKVSVNGGKIAWIYSNCLGEPNRVCSFSTCPDRG